MKHGPAVIAADRGRVALVMERLGFTAEIWQRNPGGQLYRGQRSAARAEVLRALRKMRLSYSRIAKATGVSCDALRRAEPRGNERLDALLRWERARRRSRWAARPCGSEGARS